MEPWQLQLLLGIPAVAKKDSLSDQRSSPMNPTASSHGLLRQESVKSLLLSPSLSASTLRSDAHGRGRDVASEQQSPPFDDLRGAAGSVAGSEGPETTPVRKLSASLAVPHTAASHVHRAADSVRLLSTGSPMGPGAALKDSNPSEGLPKAAVVTAVQRSPYDRHSAAIRRQRREGITDAFIRQDEAAAWSTQEGPPKTPVEAEVREQAALRVRELQERKAEFLYSVEEAAEREAQFLDKSQLASRRRLNFDLVTSGVLDVAKARRCGTANAVVALHKASVVDAMVAEECNHLFAADFARLWQPTKGLPESTVQAGTTRKDAQPPPLFSFPLPDEDKHIIMCTLYFALSLDMISNDAEFRRAVGWYRGDVQMQADKLAQTFASWSCICYTRGVVWNMVHNCFTQARKPVAWSRKPTSRAAYFGRISNAQVVSLHDRLLRDFSRQLENWKRVGVVLAADFISQTTSPRRDEKPEVVTRAPPL